MSEVSHAQDLLGSEVYDRDGQRIGRVGDVYVDDNTHRPDWVTVRSGFLAMRTSFVPLHGAVLDQGHLLLGFSARQVRTAPRVDVEHGHLSKRQGRRLYEHYGVDETGTPLPGRSDAPSAPEFRARHSRARTRGCPPEAMTTGQEPDSEPPRTETEDLPGAGPPEQPLPGNHGSTSGSAPDRAVGRLRDNDGRDG